MNVLNVKRYELTIVRISRNVASLKQGWRHDAVYFIHTRSFSAWCCTKTAQKYCTHLTSSTQLLYILHSLLVAIKLYIWDWSGFVQLGVMPRSHSVETNLLWLTNHDQATVRIILDGKQNGRYDGGALMTNEMYQHFDLTRILKQ